ncbi:MAG: transglycosylase SLT domain-containing protein [Acidobacteria bacterium]|nr:transglycosylase SLT domain-containing protein [Acidobacteriota bacterium]
MKAKFPISALLIALICISVPAQDPAIQIRQAVETRDNQTAIAELESLRRTDRKLFELNNYDYLLGRLQERRGDASAAAASFQRVVARGSILKPYALWHLSRIASASGNLILERLYLQELLTIAPESLSAEAASIRLARSLFESEDYDGAARQLARAGGAGTPNLKTDPRARENLVLLGEALFRSGKAGEAREAFLKLVDNLPNPAQPDDFALAGAIGLDRLDAGENFGRSAPGLADHLHLQRAIIYQFNRDFADARLHYRAIIERYPESGNVPDALFQIGRGYAQSANYREALIWFERLLEKFPDHPVAKDALNQSASAYARLGDSKKAIERYRAFIDKFPNDERIERGYLNIVDVLRDANDEKGALDWAAKTQEVFRGKPPEAIALFAQLRIRIAAGDWPNALIDAEKLLTFGDLGGTRVPGGTNVAEITFLKGLILENLQRFSESLDIYLSIPDGRSEYYGWRATERMRALAADPASKRFTETKTGQLRAASNQTITAENADAVRRSAQSLYRLTNDRNLLETIRATYGLIDSYRQIPTFKLLELGRRDLLKSSKDGTVAGELLFLGLYDEGAPELEKSLAGQNPNPSSDDVKFTLAVLYKRGDTANRSVAFIEPLWRKVPSDFQIELIPVDQAELLYPAPYAESLLRSATPRGVDPRYVLSIMRQESRYRADVKSVAAARGLMQFISTTSNQIAAELGRKSFRQDELYDPPTAILFGSQYLANIYKLFPGEHAAVAASYNGGEDNMKRWMARSRTELPDRYVPEIIFSQSKDYVYKVLANYRVYQFLYDERLRRRDAPKPQ